VKLLYEVYRVFEEDRRRFRSRRQYYPERWHSRRERSLLASPIVRTPLQLLVLVAIGSAVAQFIPALWCMLMQFASVFAIGLVVWFCWKLLRR